MPGIDNSWHHSLLQRSAATQLQAMVSVLQAATGAESVLVTMLDESAQQILANCSLPGLCADGVAQTTSEESICKVVFSEDAVIDRCIRVGKMNAEVREVLDTLEDAELQNAPLVKGGARVRYYSGIELVKNFAYICVLDTKPGRPVKVNSGAEFDRFTEIVCSLKSSFVAIMRTEQVFQGFARANAMLAN